MISKSRKGGSPSQAKGSSCGVSPSLFLAPPPHLKWAYSHARPTNQSSDVEPSASSADFAVPVSEQPWLSFPEHPNPWSTDLPFTEALRAFAPASPVP
jgi:hypothetical protein